MGPRVHRPLGRKGPRAQGLMAHGPRDPKTLISLRKPRFSIRRQLGGSAPGKDNSTPAEDLHNKNSLLAALGKKHSPMFCVGNMLTHISPELEKVERPTMWNHCCCCCFCVLLLLFLSSLFFVLLLLLSPLILSLLLLHSQPD